MRSGTEVVMAIESQTRTSMTAEIARRFNAWMVGLVDHQGRLGAVDHISGRPAIRAPMQTRLRVSSSTLRHPPTRDAEFMWSPYRVQAGIPSSRVVCLWSGRRGSTPQVANSESNSRIGGLGHLNPLGPRSCAYRLPAPPQSWPAAACSRLPRREGARGSAGWFGLRTQCLPTAQSVCMTGAFDSRSGAIIAGPCGFAATATIPSPCLGSGSCDRAGSTPAGPITPFSSSV